MHVRCPHCHQPIEVVEDESLQDLTCPSCGSSFNLLGGERDDIATTASHHQDPNKTIGHFELLEHLGQGQFGSVYRARDSQLDRTVAVKIPRSDQLGAHEAEQFFREARAAAQLKHPNIVSVHEVGREKNTIYIVSDFVEGVDLAEWLTGAQPTSRRSAELCAKVADALHHAHQAGIVHRDLKPSNIMMDRDGDPHIMDFGLAKRDAGEITMTVEGKILGTPAYMSPEQAKGEAHQADGRSDVYSLGVILFELLTGERPFRGTSRMLLHQVIHEDAPSPRKLNNNLSRDLDTICLRCLEKEPDKRFDSAASVSAELRRFLNGEPIRSLPISRTARTWRWCRRNPVVSGLSVSLLLLLIGAVTISSTLAYLANKNAAALTVAVGELDQETKRANKEAADARAAEGLAGQREQEMRHNLYVAYMNMIQHHWREGNVPRVEQLLDALRPAQGQDDLRGFEWHHWWHESHRYKDSWDFGRGHLGDIALTPDGKKFAVKHAKNILIVSADDGQILERLPSDRSVSNVKFLLNGTELLINTDDWKIAIWDLEEKRIRVQLELQRHSNILGHVRLAVSNDQKFVAFHGGHGGLAGTKEEYIDNLFVLDANSLQEIKRIPVKQDVQELAFSTDGKYIVGATTDLDYTSRLHSWEIESGEHKSGVKIPTNVNAIIFSPDDNLVFVGNDRGTIYIFDPKTLEVVGTSSAHENNVRDLRFSPDGKILASSSWDFSGRLWQWTDMRLQPLAVLKGHGQSVNSIVFHPDGERIYTAGGSIKIWRLSELLRSDTLRLPGERTGPRADLAAISFSPDGRRLAAIDSQYRVTVWDAQTGEVTYERIPKKNSGSFGSSQPVPIQFAPDGKGLVILDEDGSTLLLIDASDGKLRSQFRGPQRNQLSPAFSSVAFSADGDTLVTGGNQATIQVWDVGTGRCRRTIKTTLERVDDVALSPDAEIVAAVGFGGGVQLWNAKTGARVGELHVSEFRMSPSVAYSDDGRWIAAPAGKNIYVWDAVSRDLKRQLAGHTSSAQCVAFSLDDKTLASFGMDGVRLWNMATGEQVMHMEDTRSGLGGHQLAFSRQGGLMAFIQDMDSVRLLRTDRSQQK